MKRTKQLLAFLLAALLLCGMLPLGASAQGASDPVQKVQTDGSDGVKIVKSLNDAGDELTLEAYVTGEVETTQKPVPLDIVLVLDVSGSMDERFGSGQKAPTKIDSMKTAVNNFIDSVAEQASKNNVDHRISIVKFAGDSTNKIGNDNSWGTNYSQIVKELTFVKGNGAEELTDQVDDLSAGGATSADYGMEHAQTVLEKARENANKVVVLFTDGEPNHQSGFDADVAADAINTAKTLKDNETTIFTVGIFNGANTGAITDDTSEANQYMHAMSSNFPTASGKSEWSWSSFSNELVVTWGNGNVNNGYYLAASDPDGLNNVFQSISESITTPKVNADEESVLSDTLTPHFDFVDLPDGAGSSYEVKVSAASGTGTQPTWGNAETLTGVDVEVEGKEISVTGFDYSSDENVVVKKGDQWQGKKLVITFPIQPDTNCTNWDASGYYDTNSTEEGEEANLFYKGQNNSEENDTYTTLEDSPQASVTTYTVSYEWDATTKPNTESMPDLPATNSGKYYIEGQSVTVDNTTYSDITGTTADGEKGTWTFDGWYNDGNKVNGTITMGNANVTLTGKWTFEEDENYSVTYDWGEEAPDSATLPTNSNTYYQGDSVNVDPSYTSGQEVTGSKDGVPGTWTFSGWSSTDVEISNGSFSMPAQNVTLTGSWSFEEDTYTVTWMNGETKLEEDEGVAYNTAPSYDGSDPTKEATAEFEYYFAGWSTEPNATTGTNEEALPAVTKDVTYYAIFTNEKVDDYTITIQYLDEENKVLQDTTVVENQEYGAEYSYTVGEDEGNLPKTLTVGEDNYIYDDEANSEVELSGTVTGNVTITLVYTLDNWKDDDENGDTENGGDGTPDKCQAKIVYEAGNGGSVNPSGVQIVTLGTEGQPATSGEVNASATATANKDYSFDEWTSEDVSEDLTDQGETMEVSFEAQGGQTYTFTANFQGVITVTPADITIYMGGNGYEGAVSGSDTVLGDGSGLPEPGFTVTLPKGLEEEGVKVTDLEFKEADGDRTWTFKPYGEQTSTSGEDTVYRMVPAEGQEAVRVEFTKGDGTTIVSDEFEVGRDVNTTFTMALYKGKGETAVGDVIVQNGDDTYSVDSSKPATLTVRGTTDAAGYAYVESEGEEEIATYSNEPTAADGFTVAETEADTTYTINNSTVKVADDEGVALLVDEIINTEGENRTNLLIAEAKEQHTELTSDYEYEFKYLDLVDTSNGNVWVAAKDADGKPTNVTVSWPLPENADPDTVKVLHFEGLHREMDSDDISDQIGKCDVETVSHTTEGNFITFSIGSGGFSPFALAYQTKDTEGPTYNELKALIDVTVDCVNEDVQHETKTTDLIADTYTVSEPVKGTDGKYTCEVKIHAAQYVFWYVEETGRDTAHALDPNEGAEKTVTLTGTEGVDGKITWAADPATVTFNVSCNTEVIKEPGGGIIYVPTEPEDPTDPDQTGVSDLLETDDHIQYLFGYPDGSFGPNNNMTRAEAAQMFYNLLKDQDVEAESVFDDVPEGAWYATPVNVMAELGIVNGVGDNKFEPNRQITRAEFTAMAMRFAKVPSGGENIFTDVKPTDWFYSYVVNSIQYGWIEGYGDGTFRPQNLITRAEVTTIVNRMLDRQADMAYVIQHRDELNQFTDLTTEHWAYYTIVEATNEHNYKKPAIGEDWTSLK